MMPIIFLLCTQSTLGKEIHYELQSKGNIKHLDSVFFGHNGVEGHYWKDANFITGLSRINNQFIRIPGGTQSNYWDWKRGKFTRKKIGVAWVAAKNPARVKIKDYAKAIHKSSITPIFVLNMLTSNLKKQVSALKKFQRYGVRIQFVELGNEFYQDIPDHLSRYPTVDDYLDEAESYVAKLRTTFPGVKIAVIGNTRERNYDRGNSWNKALAKRNLAGADAVTMHIYGFNGEQVTRPPIAISDAQVLKFPEQEIMIEKLVQKPNDVIEVWEKFFRNDFAVNTPVWVTEFGILWLNRYDDISGLWIHGLQNIILAFHLMHIESTELLTQHAYIGNNNFGHLFANQNTFFTKTNGVLTTEKYGFTAKGYQIDLLQKFLDHATSIEPQALSSIGQKIDTSANNVLASMAVRESGKSLLLINTGEDSVKINLPEGFEDFHGQTVYANPLQRVRDSDDVHRESLSNKLNPLVIQPYSVSLLSK
ncbi:MAG: hypothetical protein HKN85_01115 [Gammaproteobacteria bacterium]|nr:hypothetical protein [Gammaproteobacteria bacterium]